VLYQRRTARHLLAMLLADGVGAYDAALRNRDGLVSLALATPLVSLRAIAHHSDRDPGGGRGGLFGG